MQQPSDDRREPLIGSNGAGAASAARVGNDSGGNKAEVAGEAAVQIDPAAGQDDSSLLSTRSYADVSPPELTHSQIFAGLTLKIIDALTILCTLNTCFTGFIANGGYLYGTVLSHVINLSNNLLFNNPVDKLNQMDSSQKRKAMLFGLAATAVFAVPAIGDIRQDIYSDYAATDSLTINAVGLCMGLLFAEGANYNACGRLPGRGNDDVTLHWTLGLLQPILQPVYQLSMAYCWTTAVQVVGSMAGYAALPYCSVIMMGLAIVQQCCEYAFYTADPLAKKSMLTQSEIHKMEAAPSDESQKFLQATYLFFTMAGLVATTGFAAAFLVLIHQGILTSAFGVELETEDRVGSRAFAVKAAITGLAAYAPRALCKIGTFAYNRCRQADVSVGRAPASEMVQRQP